MEVPIEDVLLRRVSSKSTYADSFRKTRTHTLKLKDPEVLAKYVADGYKWISRVRLPYDFIMREPTIGCYVELSVLHDVDAFPIDSPKARKLIKRLSYF